MIKRGGKDYVNFPALNAAKSLGNRWQKISRDGIHDRMKMWGLNTLAAWSSTEIRQDKKTPYTLLASIWWLTGKKTLHHFGTTTLTTYAKHSSNLPGQKMTRTALASLSEMNLNGRTDFLNLCSNFQMTTRPNSGSSGRFVTSTRRWIVSTRPGEHPFPNGTRPSKTMTQRIIKQQLKTSTPSTSSTPSLFPKIKRSY